MSATVKVDLREAYVERLLERASREDRICIVDADLSNSILTKRFSERFPDRSFQVGISEQDLVGTAVGLSAAGWIPFASSYSIFLVGRGWEQVRNAVDHGGANVKLAGCHAGLSPSLDGPTHMGIEDFALLGNLWRTRILAPADAQDVAEAVDVAVDHSGPVYFRVHRNPLPAAYDSASGSIASGGVRVVEEGDPNSILVAVGTTVPEARKAAAEMGDTDSVSPTVIALTQIAPFPREALLGRIPSGARLAVVEEHRSNLGVGALVARELLVNGSMPARFVSIGLDGSEPWSGPEQQVRTRAGLDAKSIARRVTEGWVD